MKTPLYIIVGYLLLILFLGQEIFDIRWHYLLELQNDESFRRWSGLGLAIFIAVQWGLTFVKTNKKLESKVMAFTNFHKWLGAFTPLAFYIHSMKFGFAYLFLLSITFFGNFFLGMLNLDVIKTKAQWYFQGWMIFHVAFSLLVSMLMIYHIWIVFYYE